MNNHRKWIIAAGTSIGLALAALTVAAHPGAMGGGMGHGMRGAQHQGTQDGQQHRMHGGGHHGMRGGHGSPAAQQLMTPEERTTLREKMRTAKTPEERQQIAAATRTEMQKRAAEKGITLPEARGPRGRFGPAPAATPATPSTGEHVH